MLMYMTVVVFNNSISLRKATNYPSKNPVKKRKPITHCNRFFTLTYVDASSFKNVATSSVLASNNKVCASNTLLSFDKLCEHLSE